MQLESSTNIVELDEITIKCGILFFLWAGYLWELYLLIRQYNKVKQTEEIPPELKNFIKRETFEEARFYTLAKIQFVFIQDTFSIIISTIIICFNILSLIWDYATTILSVNGEVVTSCVWLAILLTLSTIIELPLMIYYTFVIEEEFDFNNQTIGFFIWDQIKTFILVQILASIIASLVIVTIKNGSDSFFVWLWLIIGTISLIATTIYPSVIAPMFDVLTPLPEGELRTQIESLALQLNFPLDQLYVVEGSKRSSHNNAYLCGFFRTKRIVLFDTLFAKEDGSRGCTNEEILAIVAHELGHWYYNHLIKNLILSQIILFLLFAMFSFLFKYPPIYHAFGFYKEQPVLVGLIIVMQYVMMPYNAVMGYIMFYFSRKFEFEADSFAVELNKAKPLIDALIQLSKDNLTFPIYDPLYSAWHHDHPPLLERIEAIKKKAHID